MTSYLKSQINRPLLVSSILTRCNIPNLTKWQRLSLNTGALRDTGALPTNEIELESHYVS